MDWWATIDAYCERTSAAFWAEPINAVSNLAFFVAGAAGLWLLRQRGSRDHPALALSFLVLVIGTGSFLFHTFATRWASLADVLPIAIFIYSYFALALFRFLGLSRLWAGLGTLAFFAASFLAEPLFVPLVGSSAGYVPALLAMLGIGGILVFVGSPVGSLVLMAGGVFLVSLTFRTLDGPLCETLPIGTHFLWHILNGTTLGLLLVAAIRHGQTRHPAGS